MAERLSDGQLGTSILTGFSSCDLLVGELRGLDSPETQAAVANEV